MTKHFGYWVFGRDMNNVNLKTLKNNGVTDIFLNYAAFKTHGESKVLSWIEDAKKNNINIHIWMQCFYDGEWHNPAKTNLDAKINEATKYANMKNVKGVHLDYVRYPGNAYKTTNADKAITNFVKTIRNKNPNTFLSCAIMPENEGKYYYGQDINELGKIVNAVVPMQYKGNYNAGTNWLASTTKNFSAKASLWSGLQAYKSDDDTTLLSVNELTNDINTCINNGAQGVMLFRYGLSQNINFPKNSGETMTDKINTKLSIKRAISASNQDYILATLTDVNNNPIKGVNIGFADNGVKYIKTDEKGQARYNLDITKKNKYTIKIAFFGNDKYQETEKISFVVDKMGTKLTAQKLISASGKTYLLAVLTDENNKPISNVNIGFADNGVKYVATDKDGKARYTITKNGVYNIKVAFLGNDKYKESKAITFDFKVGNILTKQEIATIAKKVKETVESTYAVPNEVDGVRHGEYTYLFAQTILAGGLKDIQRKGVGAATTPSGDTITAGKIYRSAYVDMCKRMVDFVDEKGKLPSYITWDNKKVHEFLYEYVFAKIIEYMAIYNKAPDYVIADSNAFVKPQPKKTYTEEIFEYFCNKFGRPTSIDDALSKIQNKGYGYYYDDTYSNKTSIDRMKNGQGVNCTDSCQVFWHIGKALGYEVRSIHIKCRGGDGHIRLQFRKTGDFFNRDPAAVLDGECVECIWCSNGTYLATNPAWFNANLNR